MHNFSGSLILVREYPSFIVFHKVTLPHRHSLIGTSLAAFVHLDYSFFAVEIQPDQNGCERSPVGIVCHIKRACFNCITYRPSSFSPSGHFFFAFNSSFALSARLWYLFFQYSIESCLCRPSPNACLCLLILQLPNTVGLLGTNACIFSYFLRREYSLHGSLNFYAINKYKDRKHLVQQ